MYFLWQNKPAAVLAKNGDWIPKPKIPHMLDEVQIFDNPGEARHIQKTKYSRKGVSVLGEKSFKEKSRVKKLPVFREASPIPDEGRPADGPRTYSEYLELLCKGDCGNGSRVIFSPANQEQTTGTPFMQEVSRLLDAIADYLAALDSRESRLREEIRQLDLLNSDRLHQAELFELDEGECPAFVKALHDSQVERRRRKNELVSLLLSREALKAVDLAEVKRALKEIEALERQEYRCRVLTEKDPFIQAHMQPAQRKEA